MQHSITVDTTLGRSRFDVVAQPDTPSAVDVTLVLHVFTDDCKPFAVAVVDRILKMFPETGAHLRAKVYVCDFNAAVLIVSDSGVTKWSGQLAGHRFDPPAARQHFASTSLADYRACVRQHAPNDVDDRTACSHEVCYSDGASVYWAGE